MENTTNFIFTNEEVLEMEKELVQEDRAKTQVKTALAGMDKQLQREMDVIKEMTRKLEEQLEIEQAAQIELEVKQAQAKAEQEVRQKAMNEGRIESPVQAAYKELLKGIIK